MKLGGFLLPVLSMWMRLEARRTVYFGHGFVFSGRRRTPRSRKWLLLSGFCPSSGREED